MGTPAEFLNGSGFNDAGVDREAGADRRGRVERFPSSLLYAINTKIGAHGLGVPALETLKLSHALGFLEKAVCLGNLSDAIPKELIRSLHSHPTRLLVWMSLLIIFDSFSLDLSSSEKASITFSRFGRP